MASVRALLRVYLKDLGLAFLEAADGIEGLVSARLHAPALAVVDMRMPRMDGAGFLAALRKESDPQLAQTPVVVLSGDSHASDSLNESLKERAFFLLKPVQPETLLAVARQALALRTGEAN